MSFGDENIDGVVGMVAPIAATVVGGPLAGAAVSAAMTAAKGGTAEESLLSGAVSGIGGAAAGKVAGAFGGGGVGSGLEASGVGNMTGFLGESSVASTSEAGGGILSKIIGGSSGDGGKLALAKLGLESAGAITSGISARNTAKTNIGIQEKRNAMSRENLALQHREDFGRQLAMSGSSGIGISSNNAMLTDQARRDSKQMSSLNFENSVTMAKLNEAKRSSLIKPAFAAGSSILDYGIGRRERKNQAAQASLLGGKES
tara:strand:- start:624 stop:1400 length:777 start_codon:yes stop_codon:yes gene_type:complete